MRRALWIGLLGLVVVVAGVAWYVAAQPDISGDRRLAGKPTVWGCIALGRGLMLSGAVYALRHRPKAGTGGDDDRDTGSSRVIGTTIIVRQHGRRHRPTTVSVFNGSAPMWAPPEPCDKPAAAVDSAGATRASIAISEPSTRRVTSGRRGFLQPAKPMRRSAPGLRRPTSDRLLCPPAGHPLRGRVRGLIPTEAGC
jgi:hypothetical protein